MCPALPAILRSLGIISNSTLLAGASGGAVNAAAVCAGLSPAQQFHAMRDTAAICRPTRACRGFLDTAVHKQLQATLPDDSAQHCNSRLYVAVTQAQPAGQPDTPLLLGSKLDRQAAGGASRAGFLVHPGAVGACCCAAFALVTATSGGL